MKIIKFMLLFVLGVLYGLQGEVVEKTYTFDDFQITDKGNFQTVSFEDTYLSGETGTPLLPYKAVNLLLPAGEKAVSVHYEYSDRIILEGKYNLYPKQETKPVSQISGMPQLVKNEKIYSTDMIFPVQEQSSYSTQYMNGHSIGLSSFSPVRYNPLTGELSYFKKVTVKITSEKSAASIKALENLKSSVSMNHRINSLVQNKEVIDAYPVVLSQKENYQILVVTGSEFEDKFDDYINFYAQKGLIAKVVSVESILSMMDGIDTAEKIRNFIITQYQNSGIEYVLLGGDIEIVPHRGFFCTVNTPHGSSDWNTDESIPADIYYSSLDGTWNTDNDEFWAEVGEEDLFQEVSIGRFSFSNSSELETLIHKTITYQNYSVAEETKKNYLVGEWFYGDDTNPDDPMLSWGGDYLDLLIGHKEDNGYVTDGIPESFTIEKLYDKEAGYNNGWDINTLISKLNEGWATVYHFGHSNYQYTMRMSNYDITNSNFAELDGVNKNFTIINTGGCMCGGFDQQDCIGEKMVTIDNLAAAFIGNSRYGWNNEGSTDGPGTRLQRYYVDGLYAEGLDVIGDAFRYSKNKTAPFVIMEEQWEEGATRWNFYDQNLLGDPVMTVWKGDNGIVQNGAEVIESAVLNQNYPNPFNPETQISYSLVKAGNVKLAVYNTAGKKVADLVNGSKSAGSHNVKFSGAQLTSGIYYSVMQVNGKTVGKKKMMLIK